MPRQAGAEAESSVGIIFRVLSPFYVYDRRGRHIRVLALGLVLFFDLADTNTCQCRLLVLDYPAWHSFRRVVALATFVVSWQRPVALVAFVVSRQRRLIEWLSMTSSELLMIGHCRDVPNVGGTRLG